MPNFTKKISYDSLSHLFSNLVSLNRRQGQTIKDDWEYIEILDRELSSGDESDDISVIGVGSEMGDQENSQIHEKYKIICTTMSKAEIRRCLEDRITTVSTVLLLSRNEAAILLQHFKWDVNRATEEWFAYEKKVRKAVGLFVSPVVETPTDAVVIACRLCRAEFPRDLVFSVSCGHQICRSCWEGNIRDTSIDEPRCFKLRCPEISCDAAVGLPLIEFLSSEDVKIKFEKSVLDSYIAGIREAKWCPAPDCDSAVFSSYAEEGIATCRCLNSFCWRCSRDAHAPVDCDTATQWMSEGSRQSEIWVLENTVACPKCNSSYEKTQYSTDVFCAVCEHRFCGFCGEDWFNGKHEGQNLWYNPCHANGDNISHLKKSLDRYYHHFKGWTTSESSKANVLSDLKVFQDLQHDILCFNYSLSTKEVNFIVEALEQVVECWQLLKWTYVYGYYLRDDEHAKKQLHEFMQNEAIFFVNRLHNHVEVELEALLHEDVFVGKYLEFRSRTIKLTSVIRNYFDLLAEGLMDGLSEVGSMPEFSPRMKMSHSLGISSSCQKSPNSSERSIPRLKLSRARGTYSFGQISPTASPSSKIMKVEGDTNISSPASSVKSDDSWVIPEPELQSLSLSESNS
ncbi:probable E3 ubiquitin-protein ligase ARI10 [Chenopodium quinoa]|uniref:probable E3 ubiquitin-protein ligase ARI10 n=1 Tax=Chenopodium quinoa TaxID=63459 RepID=UPI000B797DBC|nr:probable E3 ubiquitin-protein ligase ARI10 [Chenopodium quinoa]